MRVGIIQYRAFTFFQLWNIAPLGSDLSWILLMVSIETFDGATMGDYGFSQIEQNQERQIVHHFRIVDVDCHAKLQSNNVGVNFF